MTRFGVILSPHGGALQKMLLPFKMGLGGRIGSGQQYWSWITLIDVVEVILHLLEGSQLAGPVNTVAPHPVTNAHFTRTLARQLGRPAALPMPALAARLVFGEMARELLLASQRVVPRKLLQDGFPFRHPELQTALEQLLGGQQKPQIKA